ncbi:Hypothetical predicted protein, partial [Paramuricea clavata]
MNLPTPIYFCWWGLVHPNILDSVGSRKKYSPSVPLTVIPYMLPITTARSRNRKQRLSPLLEIHNFKICSASDKLAIEQNDRKTRGGGGILIFRKFRGTHQNKRQISLLITV